jgi:hypothetical protein
MAAIKQPSCTLATKHKWEYLRDVTLKSITMGVSGTRMKISYRAEFKCACGAKRVGARPA